MENHKWQVSPYPNGRAFAFTLVHDADSAYSRRLAPLFDVFDALGLKITVTVFVCWAEWARGGDIWNDWRAVEPLGREFLTPLSVPLCDERERAFYLRLAEAGHEIGMHTPAETSSTRQEVVAAFDFFKDHFGYYPKVYVEHSAENNQDAQRSKGAIATSEFFNTDLLNHYQSWVWLDEQWTVIPTTHICGSPFDDQAWQKYGIKKGFIRTGGWHGGDGEAFLARYTEAAIDALEQDHGLALVYTHLDNKWLDRDRHEMRPEIQSRLQYLASKNGWFAPAGVILDRLRALEKIEIHAEPESLRIVNEGTSPVSGVTLFPPQNLCLRSRERFLTQNNNGLIVLGTLHAGATHEYSVATAAAAIQ